MNKILRTLAFAVGLVLLASPSFAQWQVPANSLPIGRGAGIVGFKNLPPGPLGYIITSNGPGLDPSYQPNGNVGTVTSITLQGGVKGSPNPITGSGVVSLDANYSGFATSNCSVAASVGSNVLTVSLKDSSGADPTAASPCNINYRNPTGSAGGTASVPQTAALSISTFAAGASLGASNVQPFQFWLVSFNNNGTNVLGLINCSTSSQIFPLNESVPATSVPISASATSAGVFYTPNGTTVAAKAFRILARIDYGSGLTTAGTYVSLPTALQMFGPGVKKPGDVVQTVYASTTTEGTTNSASFAALASGLTQSIAPTSSANLVRVSVTGVLGNSTSSTIALQLSRTVSATVTLVGVPTGNTSAGVIAPAALMVLDAPGTTSATTYGLQGKTNTGVLRFPSSSLISGVGAAITIDEIQG